MHTLSRNSYLPRSSLGPAEISFACESYFPVAFCKRDLWRTYNINCRKQQHSTPKYLRAAPEVNLLSWRSCDCWLLRSTSFFNFTTKALCSKEIFNSRTALPFEGEYRRPKYMLDLGFPSMVAGQRFWWLKRFSPKAQPVHSSGPNPGPVGLKPGLVQLIVELVG